MKSETLSELICRVRGTELDLGTLSGTCTFCGKETEHGVKPDFGDKFTAYPSLQGGGCICPPCHHLLKNQDYRKKMWVVSGGGFRFFQRSEANEILQQPHDLPFMIYFTQSWKKQGWIPLINRLNFSRERFIVGFDYDQITVLPELRDEYLALIEHLLELKLSKKELYSGQLRSKSYEKIGFDRDLVNRLRTLAGDPLWSICLFVSSKKEEVKQNDLGTT